MTEDEMIGWHHKLDGHALELTPGDSERQGSLVLLTRYNGELREPLLWRQGSQVSMRVAGGARHCSRVMVGESHLKTH